MGGPDAPTVPVRTVAEVLAACAGRGPLALAVGGFGSPRDEPHDRIGLFPWPPDGGAPLLDVWVPQAGLDALAAGLPGLAGRGGWDPMYATAWEWAWAGAGRDLRVWRRGEGVVCAVHAGDAGCGRVEAVESWLSEDWVDRGVRLRVAGGARVEVARTRAPAAAMGGWIYDGLDLLADTSWLHALGRQLAGALAVPHLDGIG